MTISAPWEIVLAGPARKALERIPAGDRQRIESVLKAMAATPFQGDVKLLEGQPRRFRRRVGAWRIFFSRIGDERRTSITY